MRRVVVGHINQTTGLSWDNFWAKGKHNVSYGIDYRRQQFNTLSSGQMTPGSEPDWLKEALRQGMAPKEVEEGLADQFKRFGTAPKAADVASWRTRPKDKLVADQAGPASKVTDVGPTVSLAGPSGAGSPFGRRR